MTPEQHRRARDVFEAALDRDPADIVGWLNDAVPDDSAVRAEVRSLLDHHSRAGSFLAQPLAEAAPYLLEEERVLAPGRVLGVYTIIREIGRGGMGRVYLASDGKLGRSVALKALAPQLTREAGHRERLHREARAAASLTHPGICTVYALEELDDELFIVTEYVEGHTLREEIASGVRPSTDTVVSTARKLAAALASAHAKGVIHRDLKPENVMRTPDGRIKILDFGLARIEGPAGVAAGTLTAAAVPGGIAGTPAYMAPEQIEGRTAGPAADVFAFGVMMYEWITGTHPFHAGTALATLARVLDSTPEPLASRADVPAWIADVVDRCLRKSPAERFASAREVLSALEAAPHPTRRWGRANTWWRVHQLAAMTLYVLAVWRAWQIKEWLREPVSLWIFVAMGVAASVAGIIRGHLIFTDEMNGARLRAEIRRTQRMKIAADIVIASALALDALLIASLWPLTTVFTICLATGIILAAVLMEPATTAAVFGDVS